MKIENVNFFRLETHQNKNSFLPTLPVNISFFKRQSYIFQSLTIFFNFQNVRSPERCQKLKEVLQTILILDVNNGLEH